MTKNEMDDISTHFVILNELPLLKGNENTMFVFRIECFNLNYRDLLAINSLNDKLQKIHAAGGKLRFANLESRLFSNNLMMVDGYMPKILSEIIVSSLTNREIRLAKLVKDIELKDPLHYGGNGEMKSYTHKIKELLRHLALGMNPSKVWTGRELIFDHYPVIYDGKEILYYIQDINRFCKLLLSNSILELISPTVFQSNEQFFIKVNLGIKFNLQHTLQ